MVNKAKHNYWLVKSDPDEYAWEDLIRDEAAVWDGVRNYQARNNIESMKAGDELLFYHSGSARAIVGVARVVSDPYPDPTAENEEQWAAVDVEAACPLSEPVTLDKIKKYKTLSDMELVRQPRLSVVPVRKSEFERIVKMGGGRLR